MKRVLKSGVPAMYAFEAIGPVGTDLEGERRKRFEADYTDRFGHDNYRRNIEAIEGKKISKTPPPQQGKEKYK